MKRPSTPIDIGEPRKPSKTGPETNLPAETISSQLDRILSSAEFVHSERLSRFLRFTVGSSLEGHKDQLKEYSLGISVFDREPSYDPRIDPIVRVEAGRLRAKLREYYQTHGRDDPVLIEFPKGSYAPVLQLRKSPEPAGARLLARLGGMRVLSCGLGFIGVTLAIIAAFLYVQNRGLRKQLDAVRPGALGEASRLVWGCTLTQDSEALVVFGSPVFFSGPEGSDLFIRLSSLNETSNINANPAFQDLQKRFGPLLGPRFDYALMGDARALQSLTAFLCRVNPRVTALPAHLATWDNVRDGNIIILGTPRMLPLLKRLPVRGDFIWDSDHNIVNRNPQSGEQAVYVTPSHFDSMSYALIGRFPGLRPNRQILSITAHSAPGIRAAVDFLTSAESLRSMVDTLKISGTEESYEMLLRVYVDSGNAVKTEYVAHRLSRKQQAK
ncbi:MAG: hypothetical protein HXY20_05705 [Acidobacteria bacterium]|nr:hypothetical protein [Acidobacteriota bacterium]